MIQVHFARFGLGLILVWLGVSLSLCWVLDMIITHPSELPKYRSKEAHFGPI
jgi:hypothetical protein